MRSDETSISPTHQRWLWALFGIAAAVRVGWVCIGWGRTPDKLNFPDEEAYLTVARAFASGHGMVDEFGFRSTYMPAYPAFLAAFVFSGKTLLLVRLIQAILAAWAAPATYLLARKFSRATKASNGDTAAVPAGLLVACDPFLIFFSGLLLTEALFAAVLVSAWIFVFSMGEKTSNSYRGAFFAGVLLLLGVMLRPSAIIVVIALLIVSLAIIRTRKAMASSSIALAVVVAGLLPWVIRNKSVIGEWRWLTTRGGISLYDGVREGATGASDLAHTKTTAEIKAMSETDWDDYWRTRSFEAMATDPARIIKLSLHKFTRTWSLTPNVEAYRQGKSAMVGAVYMIIVLLSAGAGIIFYRQQARAIVLLLLPVIAFTLLHMVYVGSVRYRVPVMPMLTVLSGAGLAGIIRGKAASRRSIACNQD